MCITRVGHGATGDNDVTAASTTGVRRHARHFRPPPPRARRHHEGDEGPRFVTGDAVDIVRDRRPRDDTTLL